MQQSSSIYQLSSCDSQTLIHNLKASMNAAPDKFLLSCRWNFFLCGEATQPKADEHNRWFLKPHSDISEITVRLEIMDKPAKHWQRLKIFVFIVSGLKVILFFFVSGNPKIWKWPPQEVRLVILSWHWEFICFSISSTVSRDWTEIGMRNSSLSH